MEQNYLTLAEAAKQSPGRPAAGAVWRWCRKGLKARNGDQVHLKHVRVGSRLYTKQAWLNEFWEELAKADLEKIKPQVVALPRLRPQPENTGIKMFAHPSTFKNAKAYLAKEGF